MRDLAIRNTHSTVVSIRAEIEATDVNGNLVPLDETLISAEVVRLQTEYNSRQYARDRATAYPTLTEQADMAYWDRLNGTTTLVDAITAVKNKYPKG